MKATPRRKEGGERGNEARLGCWLELLVTKLAGFDIDMRRKRRSWARVVEEEKTERGGQARGKKEERKRRKK